jgi:hypothetical protein
MIVQILLIALLIAAIFWVDNPKIYKSLFIVLNILLLTLIYNTFIIYTADFEQSPWYENGKIHIECSDAEYIDFNFGIMHAKRFRAEKNGVINMAECQVPPHSVYVRVTVWDKYGKPADTNAYFVEDLEKE